MAVAVGALVIAVAVFFVVRGTGGETTGTTPVSAPTVTGDQSEDPDPSSPKETDPADPGQKDAAGQVMAIDAILSDSGGARSGLGPALTQVRTCEETETGIKTIERVTEARRGQVEQVAKLGVGAIDDGAALKQSLATALGASLEADERFLAWARRHAADCAADWTTDPDYKRGLAASTKATAAKKEFLAAWNPLATAHDLPERAAHEI
ncbi:hypothetical protein [Streptosporangium sp. KLBMP 9127]|nr:hypothetical protein [Streptosporangium sp. KLBMP 9127]